MASNITDLTYIQTGFSIKFARTRSLARQAFYNEDTPHRSNLFYSLGIGLHCREIWIAFSRAIGVVYLEISIGRFYSVDDRPICSKRKKSGGSGVETSFHLRIVQHSLLFGHFHYRTSIHYGWHHGIGDCAQPHSHQYHVIHHNEAENALP